MADDFENVGASETDADGYILDRQKEGGSGDGVSTGGGDGFWAGLGKSLVKTGVDTGSSYLKPKTKAAAAAPAAPRAPAVQAAPASNSKMALYIGGGVAAVVVIFLLIKMLGGRKSA